MLTSESNTIKRLNRFVDTLDSHIAQGAVIEAIETSREWIYRNIFHGSPHSLCKIDPFSESFDTLYAYMRETKQGYYCAGFASMMTNLLTQIGLEAKTLAIGQEGMMTHAICLVKVKDKYYLHDPYYNVYYSNSYYSTDDNQLVDLKQTIQKLKEGYQIVPLPGKRILKQMLVETRVDTGLYGFPPYTEHRVSKDKKVGLTYVPFSSAYAHPLWSKTEYYYKTQRPEFNGLDPTSCFFLDPLWISSMSNGYNPEPFTDEWVRYIYS